MSAFWATTKNGLHQSCLCVAISVIREKLRFFGSSLIRRMTVGRRINHLIQPHQCRPNFFFVGGDQEFTALSEGIVMNLGNLAIVEYDFLPAIPVDVCLESCSKGSPGRSIRNRDLDRRQP